MFSGIEEKSLEISTVKFKLRCRYGIIMLNRKYISGVVSVKLQGNRNTKQLHKIRFVTKVKKKIHQPCFLNAVHAILLEIHFDVLVFYLYCMAQ